MVVVCVCVCVCGGGVGFTSTTSTMEFMLTCAIPMPRVITMQASTGYLLRGSEETFSTLCVVQSFIPSLTLHCIALYCP